MNIIILTREPDCFEQGGHNPGLQKRAWVSVNFQGTPSSTVPDESLGVCCLSVYEHKIYSRSV